MLNSLLMSSLHGKQKTNTRQVQPLWVLCTLPVLCTLVGTMCYFLSGPGKSDCPAGKYADTKPNRCDATRRWDLPWISSISQFHLHFLLMVSCRQLLFAWVKQQPWTRPNICDGTRRMNQTSRRNSLYSQKSATTKDVNVWSRQCCTRLILC